MKQFIHMATSNVPIFPLPVFLLPEGLTRLRIFEARYLKMVALATKNDGFVILPKDQNENTNRALIGSWVDITNFDQSDDGLLLIDVRCRCLVEITSMTQDDNKLHHGNVIEKAHWPDISHDKTTSMLAQSLNKLFGENDELNQLYPKQHFEQGDWVVARWLEILPVHLNEKILFVDKNSFGQAKQFLESIILSED